MHGHDRTLAQARFTTGNGVRMKTRKPLDQNCSWKSSALISHLRTLTNSGTSLPGSPMPSGGAIRCSRTLKASVIVYFAAVFFAASSSAIKSQTTESPASRRLFNSVRTGEVNNCFAVASLNGTCHCEITRPVARLNRAVILHSVIVSSCPSTTVIFARPPPNL